jgi:FdhD protein
MPGMTVHRQPADPQPPSIERQASRVRVTAYRNGTLEERDDRLSGEEPLAIRAAGPGQAPVDVAVTMRTPGHESELAAGFLRTEGLIDDAEAIEGFTFADPATSSRPDDEITVHLARPFDSSAVAEAPLRRDRLVRDLRQGEPRRGGGPL